MLTVLAVEIVYWNRELLVWELNTQITIGNAAVHYEVFIFVYTYIYSLVAGA